MSLLSRRRFSGVAVTLPFALRGVARAAVGREPKWVLLGSDKGAGIYRAAWNAATGELGAVELAVATDRPVYFAMHPKLPVIYAANELNEGKGGVSAFRVDAGSGGLTLINRESSGGDGPCFVSVDRGGQAVFVANYAGGTVATLQVEPGGSLYGVSSSGYPEAKHGPNAARQDAAHMHCATISPDGKFVLVCNLGDDVILVFPIVRDGKSTKLEMPVHVAMRAGSGPRHVAFHPNGRFLYCVHELDCTIDVYTWSVVEGRPVMTLVEGSVISTLAAGTALSGNTGCEILVSDDGQFVYTCTRGVDQIVVYRVGARGLLTEQQRLSCGGKTPRLIAFDPSRRWLMSCNQAAPGSVTVFAHDVRTGRIGETPKSYAVNTAMCVVWV